MIEGNGVRRHGSPSSRTRETEGGGFIVDRQGTILGFDGRMERLTGWPAAEVVGRSRDLVGLSVPASERDPAAARFPMYTGEERVADRPEHLELRLRCRDGSTMGVQAVAKLLPGRGERVVVEVVRVLTRSGGPASPGTHRGSDALTGLGDGDRFADRLREMHRSSRKRGRPLALILADVDHLRKVNDQVGREAGDGVLKKLAGIFRATVEDEDLIFRLGEDDFAILLPDAGRGDARQLAARLRSTVERFRFFHPRSGNERPDVTLSLGAASYPADAEGDVDLRKRAGEALDQARDFGRNRVWCYTRRPRVPVEVPVFFDSAEAPLVGITRDLSPSGAFVQTAVAMDIGMRCALAFPLPNYDGRVHVIGRIVRTVPPQREPAEEIRIPGMGIEFERFGPEDRRAIEGFLHAHEAETLRPENGLLSV